MAHTRSYTRPKLGSFSLAHLAWLIFAHSFFIIRLSQQSTTGATSPIPLYVYLGGTLPILILGFWINNYRARPLTIPQKTFLQLLMDDDDSIRNAAMLAVALSDFLDLADQNVNDAHLRPISEGLRASKRIKYLKYVSRTPQPPHQHSPPRRSLAQTCCMRCGLAALSASPTTA